MINRLLQSRLLCILTALFFAHTVAAQQWKPFPINEGEGGQRPISLAVGSDGEWVLAGTDVGGLYHSYDGGEHWVSSNLGYDALGCPSMVTDPVHPDRAFALGTTGQKKGNPSTGIYRTIDRGLSWSQVFPDPLCLRSNFKDRREALAVDRHSYDETLGYCTHIYYAQKRPGKTRKDSILYQSTDGGETWQPTSFVGPCSNVAVNPTNGHVYVAAGKKLYVSKNRGATFDELFSTNAFIGGLDAKGNSIFVGTNAAKIFVSTDGGENFSEKRSQGLISGKKYRLFSLRVNPVNHDRMLVSSRIHNDNKRMLTTDGGDTWRETKFVPKHKMMCYSPVAEKYADHAWHPTDENIAWSDNHDYFVKSVDGGETFNWSNRGYTGIYLGQGNTFQFNPHNPDYLALPSLDWNGAATYDGGKTWHETKMRKKRYGFTFASFAVEPGVWFGGDADGHNPKKGKLLLKVTRDYGKTYQKFNFNYGKQPINSSYQDPVDKDIWFFLGHRSTNAGKSWKAMDNCQAVLTHDSNNTLYGVDETSESVVYSKNQGRRWEVLTGPFKDLRDVAIDDKNQLAYVVTRRKIFQYNMESKETTELEGFLLDQYGKLDHFRSMAVDPVDPNVLYVAAGGKWYQADNSVMRSTDGGKSWHSLVVSKRWNNLHHRVENGAGGVEAIWVRVRPDTREAFFGTNCFGYWKIGPPENKSSDELKYSHN